MDAPAKHIAAAYAKYESNMLNIGRREPCGVPLLGRSTVILCDLINKECHTSEGSSKYVTKMEYSVVTTALPGRNSSTDAAILSVILNSQPLVLYEYMPVIDRRKHLVIAQHLVGLLVQGFYCLRRKEMCGTIGCSD